MLKASFVNESIDLNPNIVLLRPECPYIHTLGYLFNCGCNNRRVSQIDCIANPEKSP